MLVRHKMNASSGFMPDGAPAELPADAASYTESMRQTKDHWEKGDGYKETIFNPGIEKGYLYFWSQEVGVEYWFIAGSAKIISYRGKTKADVTRESGDYLPGGLWRWSFVNFNGVVVANNSVDSPQYFGTNNKFADMPALKSEVRFRTVCKFKNFLIGIGVDEGPGFNDDEVYWSHPADPGTLPANWDYANPATDSGKFALTSPGYLLDALELGNVLFIYKSDTVWTARIIGGSYVLGFEEKWPGLGLLAQGCVAEFLGNHFIVTRSDIVVHNGNTHRSIAEGKVKNFFFDNLSRKYYDRSFVVKRPEKEEIHIYYPSRESKGYIDRVLIWNWSNNNWEFRKVPNVTHAAVGNAISENAETWNSVNTSWERDGSWFLGEDQRVFAPALYIGSNDTDNIVTYSYDGLVLGSPLEARWERVDLVLGPLTRDGVVVQNYKNYKTVSSMTFDVESTDTFQVFIGTRDYLNEAVTWEDFGTFNPEERTELNMLLTAGFFSLRIVTKSPKFILRNLHIEFELSGVIV